MKTILPTLGVASMLLLSPATQAETYYSCSTDECSKMGNSWTLSRYADTHYPIVLAHGMLGFDSIGPLDYFYGIPGNLAMHGATVYVTTVAAMENSIVRGEQLLRQVKQIQAITGSDKVNLIGHSQGTLDSRYVASVAPSRVASVTSVGGPHRGSPVADVIDQAREVVGPELSGIVASVVDGFALFMNLLSGADYEQESLHTLDQLTTATMADFNVLFPAGLPDEGNQCGDGAQVENGVHYYSWSGTGILTNLFDPLDYVFVLTSLAFGQEPNDGLVGQCSSHLGKVIRDDYYMNHVDEVNLMFGLRSLFEVNPVSLYRQQANRLKNAGL